MGSTIWAGAAWRERQWRAKCCAACQAVLHAEPQTSAESTRPVEPPVELLRQGPAAEMMHQLRCLSMPLAE